MVLKGQYRHPMHLPQISWEERGRLEHLLGRFGPDWRLCSCSTPATPRGDVAWDDRLQHSGLKRLEFLRVLRQHGFNTRSGNGNQFVQHIKTEAYVSLSRLYS
jgi:hypothetical protein